MLELLERRVGARAFLEASLAVRRALVESRERRKRERAVEAIAAPAVAAARRIARNQEKRDLARDKRARLAARDGRPISKRRFEHAN